MKKLSVILFLLFHVCSFSQQYGLKLFSEKDGLSNNKANVLFRDSKGFLWAGTDNGLNRFDGNSFDVFRHNPADTSSIAGSKIYAIYQDKKDRMWVGTSEGISMYRPRFQNFQNFAPDTLVLKNIGTLFMALQQDGKGRIWVGTNNDLLIFDPETKKFSSSGWASFAQTHSLTGGNHLRVVVQNIVSKSTGEFWVFTTYGLYSVNTNTLQFQFYPFNKPYDYFGCQLKYAEENGTIWISLFGVGLLVYDPHQNNWTEIHIPKEISDADNSYSVKAFSGDTLMFASSGYVVFISKSKHNILETVAFDELKNKTVSSVRCLDIQKQGSSLWLATAKGLIKLTPEGQGVKFCRLSHTNSLLTIYPAVYNGQIVYTDKYGIFLGEKNFTAIQASTQKPSEKRYFTGESKTVAFFSDDNNLYSYNNQTGAIYTIPLPAPRNLENDYEIRNIVIDKNHQVWVRTVGQGIIHYDPGTKKTEFETHLPDGKNNLQHWLYYDSTGNSLWLSEEANGVFCYDLSTHVTRHYLLNIPPSQRAATILNMICDRQGNIWMSNTSNGLIFYNRKEKTFKQYNSADGLMSDNMVWLTADANGNIWASADNGVIQINTEDNSFINYPSSAGYPAANYNFISAAKNGNLFLAADSGYYVYDTKNLPATSVSSAIYLRSVTVNNKPWVLDSSYKFQPEENNLQFLPGLLNMDNTQPAAIEFRLNQGDWITIQKNSAIAFANLRAGLYRLFIRQKNNPASQVNIPFTIRAPLWKRTWFIILIFALAGALTFYFLRNWFAYIRKQAAMQQEKTRSEITALRSQMNPHFIFNTLNSINSYIIENKNEEASDYLTEFSKLIRLTLHHSQLEKVSLLDELHAVKLYLELECKRLGENFDYSIILKPDNSILHVMVPTMIIQPFVENAIWHGLRPKEGEKHILIEIEASGNQMKIIIEDNGIGREAAAGNNEKRKTDSFGMNATIKRVQLYDASSQVIIEDLKNNLGQPAGTRIVITLNKINNETAD